MFLHLSIDSREKAISLVCTAMTSNFFNLDMLLESLFWSFNDLDEEEKELSYFKDVLSPEEVQLFIKHQFVFSFASFILNPNDFAELIQKESINSDVLKSECANLIQHFTYENESSKWALENLCKMLEYCYPTHNKEFFATIVGNKMVVNKFGYLTEGKLGNRLLHIPYSGKCIYMPERFSND